MATASPPCSICGSTQGPDHACSATLLVGKLLDGRYQIESVLGQGGMGMVFRAMQVSVKRPVAVKTLHAALAASSTFFERFRREAEVASRLHHPNVITIFDFGRTSDGVCYYVMELLEGESLRQVVKREGPLTLRRAIDVIEQAARGLAHAHQHGCVHRDLKPHNLMLQTVDGAEHVTVLDFGLVKALEDDDDPLTSTGQVLGTPQYMPPEQALGEPVDARSDVYALAGVLYFCLTGSSPFGANTVRKALHAAQTRTVAPVGTQRVGAPVPRSVDEVLRKGLAKDKRERYQSVEELVQELRAAIAELSVAELEAQPARPSLRDTRSEAHEVPAQTRKGSAPLDAIDGEPAQRTADELSPPSRRRRQRRRVLAIGVPLALFLGGAVALRWIRPREQAGSAWSEVRVRITSVPAGARVSALGTVLGATPLERRFPRDQVTTLTFSLPGFAPAERAFQLTADEAIEVTLEPLGVRPSGATFTSPGNGHDIPVFE